MRDAYTMVVEKDLDSGWLIGEIVELPGCYTQAPDLPTLEANIRAAVLAWKTANDHEPENEFVGTIRFEVGV